ncbi:MAG: hypothetical protein M3Q97_00420 [Bacteroidota bacterium]|nr:hypothetical protein [Bacteroidota bacterium]
MTTGLENSCSRILFILNKKAGTGKNESLPEMLKGFCGNHSKESDILILEKKLGEEDVKQAIKDFKPDIVVAAGGDGTVNFVGKLLLNTKICLGIIPLGSSNAFAKNLKIPLEIEPALDILKNPVYREVDTLTVNDHVVLHVCDIGFNARVVERFEKFPFRGMLAYGINMVIELFRFHYFPYKVVAGKHNLKGKAFAITVTNTRIYGTLAAINPKGKMDDGQFEICIFNPPKWALPAMFIRLYRDNVDKSPFSIFIRDNNAIILNEKNASIHVDGEGKDLGKELRFVNHPSSLKVIVPKSEAVS